MEYVREPGNKIQADFALHTGKLLVQYRALTANLKPTDKYDATLTVCALQSLLTNCTELMNAMKRHQREIWFGTIPDIPSHWGIKRSFVVTNTFPSELTYDDFLTHLRNALSHPTSPDKAPNHPTTGYTTLPDDSGIISRFSFTDSPWVDRGRVHSKVSSTKEISVRETVDKFERKHGPGIGLEVRRNSQGKYEVFRDDQIYLPIFIAELPLTALIEMAIELANFLAQPIMNGWDGRAIRRLVA